MRRSCPTASLPARPTTSLVALALLSAAGCHQANGPTGGTALTPVSPLAPHGPSAAAGPRLGPFGGSTRVAPPGTGSYGTANNYLGGVAPVNATSQNFGAGNNSPGNVGARGYVAADAGSQVQPAGWTETQSMNPMFSSGNSLAGGNSFAGGNSGGMLPRLDGMPVNDFTRAPAPPGYPNRQPMLASNPWGVHSVPDRTETPYAQAGPPYALARTANAPDGAPVRFDPADAAGVASPPELRPTPVAPQFQPMPEQFRSTPQQFQSTPQQFRSTPESFPSTEPTGQSDSGRSGDSRGSDTDLPWRAPTPRY